MYFLSTRVFLLRCLKPPPQALCRASRAIILQLNSSQVRPLSSLNDVLGLPVHECVLRLERQPIACLIVPFGGFVDAGVMPVPSRYSAEATLRLRC